MQTRYFCPCCGYDTLKESPPGTYDICPVCFWEDDPYQFQNPDSESGANPISLRQAQKNFEEIGACDADMLVHVIRPDSSYNRKPDWKLK